MAEIETSLFPTDLDVQQAFWPMKDAPLGNGSLSSDINDAQTTIPVVDANLYFDAGPSLATVVSTLEIFAYTDVDSSGFNGVERGIGNSLGNNGVAGTAASSGDEVRQLLTNHQLAKITHALNAIEVKIGVDSSAVTDSHDYKIAALEGAILGNTISVNLLAQPQSGCSNGQVVTFNGTNWVPCDYITASADPPVGVIYGIVAATGNVVLYGQDSNHSGLGVLGTPQYLDPSTPGALTTTPNAWFLGLALNDTTLMLQIRQTADWPRTLKGVNFAAGVVDGRVCYYDEGTSKYDKADASDPTHIPVGVASGVVANVGNLIQEGPVAEFSGRTPGALYYLHPTTPGVIWGAHPETGEAWLLGRMITATTLWINIKKAPNASNVPVDDSGFATGMSALNVQEALNEVDTEFGTVDFDYVQANDGTVVNATSANMAKVFDGNDISADGLHSHDANYKNIFTVSGNGADLTYNGSFDLATIFLEAGQKLTLLAMGADFSDSFGEVGTGGDYATASTGSAVVNRTVGSQDYGLVFNAGDHVWMLTGLYGSRTYLGVVLSTTASSITLTANSLINGLGGLTLARPTLTGSPRLGIVADVLDGGVPTRTSKSLALDTARFEDNIDQVFGSATYETALRMWVTPHITLELTHYYFKFKRGTF